MTSPWTPTPREYLTDQAKARLFVERGGQCWKCTRKLRAGDKWIVEHVLALENGGTVRLGGVPLHGLSDEQLRCRIGYFAEDAHLFATTVRDNLLVVRGDAGDDELCGALDRVGLADWLAGLPDGLDTVLEGGAASVSAGQRRRLLLARALCSTAPVLLLDEPTEHLDRDAAAPLLRGLLTPDGLFGADRTVVVATHHLDDDRALECTRLVITAAPQAAPDYSENSRTSRS